MSSDQDRKMSSHAVNWGEKIEAINGPFLPSDTKQSWLGRGYKEVRKLNPKLSFRHFCDLFYGHVPDPKYSVAACVLTAADKAKIEEARRDAEAAAKYFDSYAQTLSSVDANTNRAEIDAFVEVARILRGRDSAGNRNAQ